LLLTLVNVNLYYLLLPPELKKLEVATSLERFSSVPAFIIFPLLVIYLVKVQVDISTINKDIKFSMSERNIAQENWNKFQQKTSLLEDAAKILDITSLYKIISNNGITPMNAISNFARAKGNNILVKSINWKLKDGRGTAQGIPNNINPNNFINVNFNVELYNDTNSYQNLFDNFDMFIKRLEEAFKNYNVSYSRITEKINFNEDSKIIPIQITIDGSNQK